MCRCDTDHSSYITSVVDSRDHAWILGATKPVEPLAKVLSKAMLDGKDVLAVQKEWLEYADLKTFDQAVAAAAASSADGLKAYQDAIASATTATSSPSITERRELAAKHVPEAYSTLLFDWDLCRTPEGSYRWAPTVDAVISRALLAAGLGEVTWSRMDYPVKSDIEAFHLGVRKVHPNRKFGFGYTGGYDWLKAGWTADEVKEFPWESSKKYGIIWHVQPIWALQGQRRAVETFSYLWQNGGIAAYMNEVQGPELGVTYPGLESREYKDAEQAGEGGYARLKFSGAYLADALLETATMGVDGIQKSLAMGEGMVKGPKVNRFG